MLAMAPATDVALVISLSSERIFVVAKTVASCPLERGAKRSI